MSQHVALHGLTLETNVPAAYITQPNDSLYIHTTAATQQLIKLRKSSQIFDACIYIDLYMGYSNSARKSAGTS